MKSRNTGFSSNISFKKLSVDFDLEKKKLFKKCKHEDFIENFIKDLTQENWDLILRFYLLEVRGIY